MFTVDGSFHDVKTAWKAVFSRGSSLSFPQQNTFSAILQLGKIAEDGEIIKSIKIIFTVRRPRTPVNALKIGDCLKPEGCFFAENVSYGRRVDPPNVLCKFACGKLEADSKPNYIGKDDSTVRRSVNRQ